MRRILFSCLALLPAQAATANDDINNAQWRVHPGTIEFSLPQQKTKFLFDGYVQADGFLPLKPNSAQEDAELRRIRPTMRIEIGDNFSSKFSTELSDGRNELQDAYGTYAFHPNFSLTAGKMKTPLGLEINQSSSDMQFIERSPVSSLLPGREYGLMADGEFSEKTISYSLGVFTNGAEDEGPDGEDWRNRTYAARVLVSPFKGSGSAFDKLQFGIGGDYGDRDSTPSRKRLTGAESSAGGELLDYLGASLADGSTIRLSPQMHWYHGPFEMMGEYAYIRQGTLNTATSARDTLAFHAAQLSVGYVLTGENTTYGHLNPARPFNPSAGQWGAWEVTGRIAYVDVSDANDARFVDTTASADNLTALTAGLNWHLNNYVKVLLNYEYATFDQNLPEEQSVFSRLQLEF
ncbi:MAG: hypothetical protein FJX23_01140 [Alphaproteobacteria bacterium]|nr:hypothetical protein [Alphaproteobacteria bacterium]